MGRAAWLLLLFSTTALCACPGSPSAPADRAAPPATDHSLSFVDGRGAELGRSDRPPGETAAAPPLHVVIVGWDGVQRDHLQACLARTDPGCPGGLPNLSALGKVWNLTVTSGATVTKPGWAQLLSGYSAALMGIHDNTNFAPLPLGYSIFEKFEQHFGAASVVTLFIAGKDAHTGGSCTTTPREPWCLAKRAMDTFENNLGENQLVGQRALALLEQHKAAPRLLAFFHFWDPDHTGHASGESSAAYTAKILDDDAWLGKIVDKLKALGLEGRALVYVVTDHGFDEAKTSHHNAPYGFLASNDLSLVRGGDRMDLTPHILKRFGLGLAAAGTVPAVTGQPLDSIPSSCRAEGKAFIDYPGAPACCTGLKLVGLGKLVSGACLAATGGTGDRSGYCVDCGNGVCKAPETRCNCPGDCP